jgi:hypothetical protein
MTLEQRQIIFKEDKYLISKIKIKSYQIILRHKK